MNRPSQRSIKSIYSRPSVKWFRIKVMGRPGIEAYMGASIEPAFRVAGAINLSLVAWGTALQWFT